MTDPIDFIRADIINARQGDLGWEEINLGELVEDYADEIELTTDDLDALVKAHPDIYVGPGGMGYSLVHSDRGEATYTFAAWSALHLRVATDGLLAVHETHPY